MKRRVWKHSCNSETVSSFIEEKTGRTIESITKWTGKSFKRFEEVKEVLLEASKTGREVYIIGDYDSDGINSICILALLCYRVGLKFKLIIPKRETEGYGLSQKIIDRIPDGVVLITIDNGITAVEQMKQAKKRGMYTIVLDHHTAAASSEEEECNGNALLLPDVDILIDPSAIGEADYRHYCGAGIAYRLAEFILNDDDPVLKTMSTFAAIGTIGDVVELSGDNRQIVKEGLENIKKGYGTAALQELVRQSKITASSTATDFAFNVVPAINAPERLEDGGASKVCNVLLKSNNYSEGISWLLDTNGKRKQLVNRIMEKIDVEAMKKSKKTVNIVAEDWIPLGIAGIIAGRLSEQTGKPSFVFGKDPEGNYKGSARNKAKGINIIHEIRKHEKLLLKCGGHSGAAGLTIAKEYIKEFEEKMCECIPACNNDENEYTLWDVSANDLNIKKVSEQILALEPCGEGMPTPIVRIKSRLVEAQPFGGDIKDVPDAEKPHIRFNFAGFNAVGFNMNDWYQEQLNALKVINEKPRFVEVVGTITDNEYKGKHSIQLRMNDFELS